MTADLDKLDFRALWKVTYGLYVVGVNHNGRLNGQIVNTAFQLTAEPPTFGISINRENLTYELLKESRKFALSVLGISAPLKLIGLFGFRSGRDIDKFSQVNYKLGYTGSPILLDHTVAYIECEVFKEVDLSTHTLFIGNIVSGEVLSDEEPLTYAQYHELKKGKTPKRATTYISEELMK